MLFMWEGLPAAIHIPREHPIATGRRSQSLKISCFNNIGGQGEGDENSSIGETRRPRGSVRRVACFHQAAIV